MVEPVFLSVNFVFFRDLSDLALYYFSSLERYPFAGYPHTLNLFVEAGSVFVNNDSVVRTMIGIKK